MNSIAIPTPFEFKLKCLMNCLVKGYCIPLALSL